MTFLEKLQVIERVDGLIRRKATGTAEELASKLGVSRRCVYNIIALMKKMNAPIEYNSIKKSYYYSSECNLTIGFVNKKKIEGGNNFFLEECRFNAQFSSNLVASFSGRGYSPNP